VTKSQFALGDYVDVATRITEFREKHPDGSLQPADLSEPFRVVTIGGDTFVCVVAAAYRAPDDQRPGIGMAYESYPGRTPYTRGSELQNAETSAWGRAIVAALAADTKRGGVASQDEVRNRQADRDAEWEAVQPAQPDQAGRYDEFVPEIDRAAASEIPEIGRRVKAALAANEITPTQNRKLAELAAARLAELDATP